MTPLRWSAACGALLAGLLSSACLTPEQIAALQKDVSDMRGQMESLRKENREAVTSVEAIKTSILAREDSSRQQAAESKRQIESIRDDLRVLGSRLEELQHRLSGLSSMPAPGPRSPSPSFPPPAILPESDRGQAPPAAAGAAGDSDDVFNSAYADYSKGNYAPAILGFEEFLKRHPRSEKADDALYWIGLCHYDQGEYAEAIARFDRLIQEYPNGDKIPGAHLKKGLSLLEMNRTAQGVVQLQYLLERFPKSEESRIARDRLSEIGVKP